MPLIIAIALLSVLKFLEVGFLAEFSWWWVVGMVALAFIWFELVEPTLGLDKRRASDQLESAREERLKKTFDRNRPKRR
jgi:small Trp-rich protein